MSDALDIVHPTIAVYAARERARTWVKSAFPRRRCRVVLARSAADLSALFRAELVDSAVVDLGVSGDDTSAACAVAQEFPGVPFFGLSGLLAGDGPAVAHA